MKNNPLIINPSLHASRSTLIRRLHSESGQFIPISAMVMFTVVIMMVAALNIYKVSRAKLQVQNLADAAALNLASKEAQIMNIVADRNEWMNHMVAGDPSPSGDPSTNALPGCRPDNPKSIPGISCVERSATSQGHIFHSHEGATNYARLVQTINMAQNLFVKAYDSFLGGPQGASSGGNISGAADYKSLLMKDIPDLKDVNMVAWNSGSDMQAQGDCPPNCGAGGNQGKMDSLKFHVDHDISTQYYEVTVIGHREVPKPAKFSELVKSQTPVGWMVPNMPRLSASGAAGSSGGMPGVGVSIVKQVTLPGFGSIPVSATSKAYIVESAGQSGSGNNGAPVFSPTYWVKLSQ